MAGSSSPLRGLRDSNLGRSRADPWNTFKGGSETDFHSSLIQNQWTRAMAQHSSQRPEEGSNDSGESHETREGKGDDANMLSCRIGKWATATGVDLPVSVSRDPRALWKSP